MRTQILKLDYQRNGISGIGFYTAIVRVTDTDEHIPDLIVTFETTDKGTVNIARTRVVNPLDIHEHWRGDVFGQAIQRELTRLKRRYKVKYIYDVMEKLKHEEVGR